MRAHVSIRDLRQALSTVQPAVNRASNLPFAPVHMVRVTAGRNGVQFTAASRDVSIQTTIFNRNDRRRAARGFERPARRGLRWAAIVNFDPFRTFLRGAHPDDASVELALTDDWMLRVGIAARSVSLATLDPTQWPALQTPPLSRLAGEPLLPLRSWWERIVPACAPVKTTGFRPILTGINLRWTDGTLTAAAIDSYRGHVLTTQAKQLREVDLTIPPAALKAALDAAKAEGDPLSMWTTADHPPADVAFRTQRTTVRTRVIEGDFPPASMWLPDVSEYTTVVRIKDAAAAVAALRSICRQVDPESTPVMLEFDRGIATFSTEASEVLTISKDTLAGLVLEAAEGPVVARWCNPRYLADAIAATGDNGTLLLHPLALDTKLVLRNGEFAGLVMLVNPAAVR